MLLKAPAWSVPTWPLGALWSVVQIMTMPKAKSEVAPRIDLQHQAAARARLAAAGAHLVVDGGTEMVGLWLLDAPLADMERARRLLHRLAIATGGDPGQSVGVALVDWPGLTHHGLFPRCTITAERWSDQRIDVDALERALGA